MTFSVELGSQTKQQQLANTKSWLKRQGYVFFVIVSIMLICGWGSVIQLILGEANALMYAVIAGSCIVPLEACNKWRRDLEDEIARLEGRSLIVQRSSNVS